VGAKRYYDRNQELLQTDGFAPTRYREVVLTASNNQVFPYE